MRRVIEQLNIVVSCAARKSRPPLPGLSVRDISSSKFSARLAQWISRMNASADAERMAASSLYRGDHWATVRRLIAESSGSPPVVRVWIASAGCGLLSPESHIPPYAATFASRLPDSVAESAEERRLWWGGLTSVRKETGNPCSLTELVRSSPASALLVTASPEYLCAISVDLASAAENMSQPERLTVLCREGVSLGVLDDARVHLSAELSSELGGALTSLNVRVVRWLVPRLAGSFHRAAIREAVDELRSTCAPRIRTARVKRTDEQISFFIRNLLKRDSKASGAAALTLFRKAGMAAEQRRFRDLFQAVRQEVTIG